jgi:hypothetical protein
MRRNQSTERYARAEGFGVFTHPQRSWPARLLGLVIRLRAEVAVAIVALAAWAWLTDRMPAWGAALVLGVPALGLGLQPLARRYLVRRCLAVLTRHRLRAVFVQRQVMNWTGNVPILLWSRPTPIGERVWLLLRAGVDVVDIERNLPHVASGCHARAARVGSHRSVRSLATVDVIRRDPLTATPARTEPRAPLHVVSDLPKGA